MILAKNSLNFVETELSSFFNSLNETNKKLRMFLKFEFTSKLSYENKEIQISDPPKKFIPKVKTVNLKKSNKNIF
jgi:hypothetical protein